MIPMQIEVFDVGHGHCTVLTASSGRRMMLDCGHRWGDDRFWTPSLHFFRRTIDLLVLMNLDEDHLSDFENVMRDCTVPWILSNPTVGSREFWALKKDGMGPGAQAVAAWLAQPKIRCPGRSRILGMSRSAGTIPSLSRGPRTRPTISALR
jgi:beta-lactamase superfamily II metal-dependent hydrolase